MVWQKNLKWLTGEMELRGKRRFGTLDKENVWCTEDKYFSDINLLLPHTDLSSNDDDK